jgi:membrane-associated phospholipid phosphatase
VNLNLKAAERYVFAAVLMLSTAVVTQYTLAQTTPGASPAPTPTPSPTPAPEKKLLTNILHDQKAIWTSPFRLQVDDLKWLVPLGAATAALIATDQRTTNELVEHGNNQTRIDVSNGISQLGAGYTTFGISAAFYLVGRVEGDARARETGLLGAEALINTAIVTTVLKGISQRPRPTHDNGRGNFRDDGDSFPSGHSASAWALATVIADEYHQHKWVIFTAYGMATAVSVARYTGRNHFLSDSLVGGAIGYGIGHHVYNRHHDPAVNITEGPHQHRNWTKYVPFVTPRYARATETYGLTLLWDF